MIYNIEKIIHKVYAIPQLKKLSNYRCFDHILDNLDENLANKISKISYRYGYIYFSVTHPSIKMTLQYKLEQLEMMFESYETCKYIKDNFKGFYIEISTNF